MADDDNLIVVTLILLSRVLQVDSFVNAVGTTSCLFCGIDTIITYKSGLNTTYKSYTIVYSKYKHVIFQDQQGTHSTDSPIQPSTH